MTSAGVSDLGGGALWALDPGLRNLTDAGVSETAVTKVIPQLLEKLQTGYVHTHTYIHTQYTHTHIFDLMV